MMEVPFSQHLDAVQAASAPFIEFLTTSAWGKRMGEPGICDFVAGNPQDMALPGYVEAIRRASIPQNPHWFAYKANEPVAREVAAASLSDRLTIPFDADDIFMTKGASTALAIALATVLSPGDEVIFLSPPWFFYESMIAFSRGVPVRVKVDLATFAPDIDAIDDAITSRTRAVIINSPNNPTGRIYPPETLDRLATLLTDASEQHGRTIYLLSDEAYNRILFDGRRFPSPATHYPNTSCSTATARRCWRPVSGSATSPSPPTMPGRERMRGAILATQFSGYGVPDAVLQHAIPDLEPLCIDLVQLQRRRDTLVSELSGQGYEVHVPEGAFYLLPRSPVPDDVAFAELLAGDDVFVLPGRIVELPGYFRISLTANDEMVERSISRFGAAIDAVSG